MLIIILKNVSVINSTGKRIWRYTGFTLDEGYPKVVNESNVLFPRRPHAAMTYNIRGRERIYIFSVSTGYFNL